jgi:hypothetical protein
MMPGRIYTESDVMIRMGHKIKIVFCSKVTNVRYISQIVIITAVFATAPDTQLIIGENKREV